MSDTRLDVLLAQAHEPEPIDDGFVASVMRDIELLPERPSRLAALRRPVFVATVTAVVLTGGAVAALVGTNVIGPDGDERSSGSPRASAIVTSRQQESGSEGRSSGSKSTPVASEEAKTAIEGTGHSVSVVDPKTGLRLQTETHTNDFTTGVPQRVTLTMTNTGRGALAVTGHKDCLLQAMAFPMQDGPAGTDQTPKQYYEEHRNQNSTEWECGRSGDDPRSPKLETETLVLQPGDVREEVTMLTLDTPGSWAVMGMCGCEVADSSAPAPPKDSLDGLTRKVLPSPLVQIDIDTEAGLITPPVRVRARD